MRSLSQRATAGLVLVCVLFTLAVSAVSLVALRAVHSAAAVTTRITDDEMATALATAQVGRQLDNAYLDGTGLVRTTDSARRALLADRLYNTSLPKLEQSLQSLVTLHADDEPVEHQRIDVFVGRWQTLRAQLNDI